MAWMRVSVSSAEGELQREQVQVKWKPCWRCCWRRVVGSRGVVSCLHVSSLGIRGERGGGRELTSDCYFLAFRYGSCDADNVGEVVGVNDILCTYFTTLR